MAGMRLASTDGAGWFVETVELALTSRRRVTRRRGRGSRHPWHPATWPGPACLPAALFDGAECIALQRAGDHKILAGLAELHLITYADLAFIGSALR